MLNTVQSNILSDGSRLHLNHGPIDLIIEAFGETETVQCAYERATNKFNNVLTDLVRELPALRSPISQNRDTLKSPVGMRMQNAVQPFYPTFVTPMAAVAGSVADYVLKILCEGDKLRKAYVNNGGDIAIHLDQHEVFNIGIITNLKTRAVAGTVSIGKKDAINGIATSGWHGRSHSLGIADAVTVLAPNAAQADTAATLIANAVDLPGSTLITKVPAKELFPDTDLGDKLVTTGVALLPKHLAVMAVEKGCKRANEYISRGLITAATISLQGVIKVVGPNRILTQY